MSFQLSDLRTMVRDGGQLSANDPMFPDGVINRQINMAMHKVSRAQPGGWWWQQVETSQQNGASAVEKVSLIPGTGCFITAVLHVFCSVDLDYFQQVPIRERSDGLRRSGGLRTQDGFPITVSVAPGANTLEGSPAIRHSLQLVFEPWLPANMWMRVLEVQHPLDLANDADLLYMPDLASEAIVELALAALTRQQRSVNRSQARARAASISLHEALAAEAITALRLYLPSGYAGAGQNPIERTYV